MTEIIDISRYKPKKPVVTLKYNGQDASSDFSKYLSSLEFREYEDEQSDELSLSLNDNDNYFSNLWYPEKGDKLECSIGYGADNFSLGIFTIDENSFNFGTEGARLELKALATSTNFSVRTAKITNWSGYTLNQIAAKIGKSYGFEVLGNTGNISAGTIVQKNESDIAFLKRISRLYGYIFSIKDGYLTFIDLSELENADTLFDLDKTQINSLNLTDTVTKIYGKATVQYLDLKTKTVKSYTAVGNTEITDTLKIYKRCSSLNEAQIVANAALKNSSREVTGRIVLSKPNKIFMAGVNFNLTESENAVEGDNAFNLAPVPLSFGKFKGKYHIKNHTLKLDENGLTQEGEIVLC
ncbi:MAG: hypothetical protein LUE64_04400 [Candidatus Gastranaerophilales bacterium]|nr:hypothetical protein [Candidatus Gastranaerophilales bacterium]